MSCSCMDQIDESLKERNLRLVRSLDLTTGRSLPYLQLEPIEKKRGQKKALIIPSFCPFCGEALPSKVAVVA